MNKDGSLNAVAGDYAGLDRWVGGVCVCVCGWVGALICVSNVCVPAAARKWSLSVNLPTDVSHTTADRRARFVARKKLWSDMEAAGLAIKKEDYAMRCALAGWPATY
jgi:hypothetical protein